MTGKIIGLGAYLPEKILTNDDLAGMVDTCDEWISERTGIKQRHISDPLTEKPSQMVVKAAVQAVEDAGIDPKDIDLIINASTTSDLMFPTLSCVIHKALGAGTDCATFDVNSACPGWLAAYNTAQNYIAAGNAKLVLVTGVECTSNFVNWEDRGQCILFGDGAGAVVLKAEEGEPNKYTMRSFGELMDCLRCENARQPGRKNEEGFEGLTMFNMDGREVFRFAVTEVPKTIRNLSSKYDFKLNDVDWFVLHQANARIIETTARKLKVSMDKFPMNIQNTGNTSCASIPILLREMKDKGQLKRGMKLVLASFGGGLTCDANYIEY